MEMSSMRLSDKQRVELYTSEEGEGYIILIDSVVEEFVMQPATALALLKWLAGMKKS